MKRLILVLACLGLFTGLSSATDSNFGLGIILGAPTGISARIATGPANSVNAILGYAVGGPGVCCRDGGHIFMGADYVWYNYNLIPVAKGRLPLYFGPGINATFSNDSRLGIRGVVGLEYQFASAPVDLFLELGPGINVMPNTDGYVTGGFGGRFFF